MAKLQMDHTWVTFRSTIVTYGFKMNHTVGCLWIVYGSRMSHKWVTYESLISHTLVTLLNTTFLIFFSKLINLWSCHNPATLRIRKMNLIFDQTNEIYPGVSLATLLWSVTSRDGDICKYQYRYFLHDDIDISIWHRYSPSIKNRLSSIFHEVHCYLCT